MLRVTAAVIAGIGLFLTSACGGGSDASTDSPTSGPTSSAASSATTSASPTETASAEAVQISVAVKDGKVSPKTHREKVPLGSQVRLIVSSDVDDEVHVHGYDIEKEVAAGQSVTFEFTADQPGVFEVETHESGLQLLQLEVS
jgi:heme/copper-type cytochrome/quinol oxidase subunit 2